ncbi:MAG: YceI family protein [Nannocystaceae bacterium]
MLAAAVFVGCGLDTTIGDGPTRASESSHAASAQATIELTAIPDASSVVLRVRKATGEHHLTFSGVRATSTALKSQVVSLHVEIDTASLSGKPEALAREVRGKAFLDAQTHPVARFRSTVIERGTPEDDRYRVRGTLEIRGKTTPVQFPISLTRAPGRLIGRGTLHIHAQDYGIQAPPLIAEDGRPRSRARDAHRFPLRPGGPRRSRASVAGVDRHRGPHA